MTTTKKSILATAAIAVIGAALLLVNQPALVPVNPRVITWTPAQFSFPPAAKAYTRFALESNDGSGWRMSPWTVEATNELAMFRAVADLAVTGSPSIKFEITPEFPVLVSRDEFNQVLGRYTHDTNIYGAVLVIVPGTDAPAHHRFQGRTLNAAIAAQNQEHL